MQTPLMPRSSFVRRYLVAMSVLIVAGIFLVLALRARLQERALLSPAAAVEAGPLPVVASVGAFSLTDQTGAAFSSDALAGKIYVADFFFTSCSNICPVMTKAMAGVQETFANDPRVSFVSISVDPATDTPEVLARFATRYGAEPGRWHFLTGPEAEIQQLAKSQFLVGYGDEPVFHSSRFVLVDGTGKIRGFYVGTEPASIAALQQDIGRLLSETKV